MKLVINTAGSNNVAMATLAAQLTRQKRYWLIVVVLGLAIYILLPQVGDFHSSFHLLGKLNWPDVWWAVGLAGLTYVAAAATYCFLAFRPLSYGRTLRVQLAAMFVNRLLPAGVGALGVNYLYLRATRHSSSQAATTVAINNSIGLIGHFGLTAVVFLLYGHSLAAVRFRFSPGLTSHLWLIIFGISTASIISGYYFRRRLEATFSDMWRQLLSYRHRLHRLVLAMLSSLSLTLANVMCLWVCLEALNIHLPFVVALAVFTVGLAAGNFTPTPGGLGGIEAGLVAALVAYHVANAQALAAVILYRLISYWLALAVGAIAFVVCQQRGDLNSS